MTVDAFTCCSFGAVRDAGLVTPNVLPSSVSWCNHLPRLREYFFALVGFASGCSRGVNESMPEIPVNSNTLPFGEDYGGRRECTHDALTINEGSGAAVPVTPHTDPPGDLVSRVLLRTMAHVLEQWPDALTS